MDHRLKSTTRQETDKILTKTMINNYAKNDLLPPPVKRNIPRSIFWCLSLFIISRDFCRSVISRSCCSRSQIVFRERRRTDTFRYLRRSFPDGRKRDPDTEKDVARHFEQAQKSFADADEESRDFLQQFYFICMLSFDVYVKKLLIES